MEREIYDNDQWQPYNPWEQPPNQPNEGNPNSGAPAQTMPPPAGYQDPNIAEVERRYNGGSPPAIPLNPGHGWEWDGWDWQQVQGRGLGYSAGGPAPTPTPTPTPPGPGGGGGGAVPPMRSNINAPPAQLPGDILALFNRVPEKTPVQSAYQDALLNYMKRGQETPTLNDSILGPQVEVFRAAQQRGTERNRRQVAERAAATGQSESGYLDQQIRKGQQEQNFNTAQFNSGLLAKEMGTRREELQAALQLARATGDAEAERELRTRLAQVAAAMQQQGLNLQGQLGAGDLALRELLAQMGNDQFYDQLGVNTQLGLEGLNQRALQIIMGGAG